MERDEKLIVYSCSGSSNVAQAANWLAVRLDRAGLAQMSCIAGVGAGIRSLVATARSGRPILAIDGCPLACCRAALATRGVVPSKHLDLSKEGMTKCQHQDPDETRLEQLWEHCVVPAVDELRRNAPARGDAKESAT